ncbi:MAG: hypothetical protein IAE99_07910 [Rhodothermales bacterium]|nr:hypothetical protein [Rhodothermales bacterium]
MEPSDLLVIPGGALAVKAETPDTLTVAGLLVVFDEPGTANRDLAGEYFTAGTYLGPQAAKTAPFEIEATFNHGFAPDVRLAPLCEHEYAPLKVQRTDAGMMAELVLNLRDDYEAMLADLARQGKLGWSSGSASHRVRTAGDGEIKRWPLAEGAITPTPCEPRTSATPVKAVPLSAYAAKARAHDAGSLSARVNRVAQALNALDQYDLYTDRYVVWTMVQDVYEDTVVALVRRGDEERHYRIPYTDDGRAVTLAPSSDWTEVERVVSYDDVAEALKAFNDEQDTLAALRSIS